VCSNSDVHERHSITSTQSASQTQRKRKLLPSSPHPKFLQYITFPRWGEVLSVVRVLHPAAPAVFSLLPCEKRQTNHAAIRLDPSTHSFVPGQKFFRSFSVGSFRPYFNCPLSFLTLAPPLHHAKVSRMTLHPILLSYPDRGGKGPGMYSSNGSVRFYL